MSCKHPLERAFTGQQGSVLLGGLLLVLAMTVIGIALYQASVIESQQISKTETDMRAFYAADAGIHRAALDLADPPSAGILVGGLTFDAVKTGLPGDNTTLVTLTGFGSTCFGGNICDGSVTPYKPAYLVQARNDTANLDRFWLISTACTPGPAKNPCDPGHKMAQIQTKIVKNVITGPPGPSGPPGPETSNFTFPWAAFGGGSLKMGAGIVDSYNSHKAGCTAPCPYGGSNLGSNGDIGSNGSMDLKGTNIKGDVTNTTDVPSDSSDISFDSAVRVQGNVVSGGTVVIGSMTNPDGQSGGNGSGTTSQVTGTVTNSTASSQVSMDPLQNCKSENPTGFSDLTGKITQYPFNADKTCNWTATPIAATWTYGGTTGCGSCGAGKTGTGAFVANNICIAISPGNYCVGTVTITGGDAGLLVTDRTVLTVDGKFSASGGNGVRNESSLPQNLQLISTYGNDAGETGDGIVITGGSSAFYGTIYAPTTSVKITGGTPEFYGGIMAKSMDLGSTRLHYDEFLASGNANLEKGAPGPPGTPPTTLATIYTLLGWKKVECGPSTFAC